MPMNKGDSTTDCAVLNFSLFFFLQFQKFLTSIEGGPGTSKRDLMAMLLLAEYQKKSED